MMQTVGLFEFSRQHGIRGGGLPGVIVAVIQQAFLDCGRPSGVPKNVIRRTRFEAAYWLLTVGINYWRWLRLDDDLFTLACRELIPPRLYNEVLHAMSFPSAEDVVVISSVTES